MLPWLVLPVRSLAGGKSRLAPCLDATARHALNAELLRRTLALAARYPGLDRTLVVSRCAQVLSMARQAGAQVLAEQGCGLVAAVSQAAAALRTTDAGMLVLSCDLPWATDGELRALPHPHDVVLATDQAGLGTNALSLPPGTGFDFHYGAASRYRHAEEARRRGLRCRVVQLPGLAFDLDTPADYGAWRQRAAPALDELRRSWPSPRHRQPACGP